MNRIKQILYLLSFVLLMASASAQVKVDAKATGKHQDAISNAKAARQKAKERREQAREIKRAIKDQKKARKLFMERYAELKEQRLDSLPLLDSLARQKLSIRDSLEIAREVLNQSDFPPEYRELIVNPPNLTRAALRNGDSLAVSKVTRLAEQMAREYMPNELQASDDPLAGIEDPTGGVINTSLKAPTKPNPNLIKPDMAQAMFKKIDPEKFQESQAEIQKLKKKYSELPDTRFPEEGTKRNSLEKIPFAKRIYIGGNISLASTDPLVLSSNLQLGYWINKKWLAGVGLTLREQLSSQDSVASITGDGYGFSVFTRYNIVKGLFAWGEGEFQLNRSFFGTSERAPEAQWQQAYLLGIGREFKIGRVRMMSVLMYDFNYRSNDLNATPLVFRFGVQFSKRPR